MRLRPYVDTPVLVGYEKTINSLVRWYFSRDHIVGQGKDYYFIFDEITNTLQYFNSQGEWEKAVKLKQLEPFYTRWCTISDSPDSFVLAIVLSSFTTVPIFLIVLCVIIWMTYTKTIIWTKKTWFVFLATVLALSFLLLCRLNIHSF